MRRREFITYLGGAAAAWPLAVLAQPSAVPVIGFLDNTTAASSANRVSAFRQGLNESGFVEGRNVAIEYRWAEGQLDRLLESAADLVRRRVAVIVASGTTSRAAKAATSTIPIVLIIGADPVASGIVTSFNRPGANITGVTYTTTPLNSKRLELLHELVPKPAVIAGLWYWINPVDPVWETGLREIEVAAHALGRQTLILKAGTEGEIDAAFATIGQAGAGALFVGVNAFFYSRRRQLVALAARHALPASY